MIEVSDPTGFGRELAKIIFGTDANCLLVDFTVGQGSRSTCKAGVYFSLESLFETVVRDRFPDDTEYCLSRAFDAANQVGRDCRRQLLVQTFGRNRFIWYWMTFVRKKSLVASFSPKYDSWGICFDNSFQPIEAETLWESDFEKVTSNVINLFEPCISNCCFCYLLLLELNFLK